MIDNFYGEFLLHPAPLEVSGNTCSHNCAYCFSNIRCSARYANPVSFINSLKKSESENTLNRALINRGFSICVSNRTDPFSQSNKSITDTFIKYLVNRENGIFFQTKGGNNFKSTCDFILSSGKENIVSYFTITAKNDEISKKIEPGAPLYKERVDQIKYAILCGHLVIVAFNPLCEEWMPENDFNEVFKEMIDCGVKHFIFQRLHMTAMDIKTFSPDRLSRFGNELQKATVKKKNEGQLYLQKLITSKMNSGVNVLAFGMPYRTNFFIDVRKKLGKCFPSNYDFINYCFDNGEGFYSFDDYVKALNPDQIFYENFKRIDTYIFRVARQAWKGNKEAQSVKTLLDVLRIYWNDKRISGSVQNNFLFKKRVSDGLLYFDGNIHRDSREL